MSDPSFPEHLFLIPDMHSISHVLPHWWLHLQYKELQSLGDPPLYKALTFDPNMQIYNQVLIRKFRENVNICLSFSLSLNWTVLEHWHVKANCFDKSMWNIWLLTQLPKNPDMCLLSSAHTVAHQTATQILIPRAKHKY